MDLLFFIQTLFIANKDQFKKLGADKPSAGLSSRREGGEIILPLVFAITLGSLLLGVLLGLNKLYEKKTQEHLSDFKKSWNHLQKKYQD